MKLLAESLFQTRNKLAHSEVFIGRVQYLPNKSLMSFAKEFSQKTIASSASVLLSKTLLVKRPAFKHEREVRLLFIPHNEVHRKQDIFQYPVDPNILINQIMIDPRMSATNANSLKQEIRAKTGYRGAIKRSLLYAPPPDFISARL